MRSRKTCPDDICGDHAVPALYDIKPISDTVYLTSDGSLGSRFDTLGNITEWGKFEDGVLIGPGPLFILPLGGKGTFRRDDSPMGGVFYMPPFHMPGTVDENVRTISRVLLGSRDFDGPGDTPGTLNPLKEGGASSQADRGNGFFAGLTMGPEEFDSLAEGSGEILTDDLDIRFNGNADHKSFVITDHTKYVLRPCGVTGVFNTTFSGILNIYGYDIDFTRFAFRQVCNKLDGKTFLDGSIDIPYPCDITVAFLELDLTCSGDLGSGEVDSEAEADWRAPDGVDNDGDTLTDEGNGVMSYWKAPISINGMGFVPTGNDPDPCVNNENKELELITLIDFNGFEKDFTMSAIYPSNGKIKNQEMTGAVENAFDEPMSSSEPGWNIRVQKGYLNQLANYPAQMEGFLNMTGLSDVPLFNDVELHKHYENPEPMNGSLPDGSFGIDVFKDESDTDTDFDGVADAYGSNVTNYRNLLANTEDAPEATDPRPRAKYSWPASGLIEFNYALNYNRSDGTQSPQYLGVPKVYNLVSDSNPVVTVQSVPDYINPMRTKLSAGVSADFAQITNFQVNLTDLGDIDDFLHNYLGVSPSFSLENILGNMVDTSNILKEVAGGDLTEILGDVVDLALCQPAILNVFDVFSQGIGEINRIPEEISQRTAMILDEFRGELAGQLTQSGAPIAGAGGQLEQLFNVLAAYVAAPPEVLPSMAGFPYDATEHNAALGQIDALLGELAEIQEVLCDVHGAIQTAQGEVNSIIAILIGLLTEVNDALNDVKNLLNGLPFTSGNLANNPILSEVNDLKNRVRDVLNAIQSVDLGLLGSALQAAAGLAGTSIDTSAIDDIHSSIDSLASSLEEIIDEAESLLQNALGPMPNIFNEAEMLLDLITANTTLVKSQIEAVQGTIIGYLQAADDQVGGLKTQFQALGDILSDDVLDPGLPTYNDVLMLGQQRLNDFATMLVDNMLMDFNTGVLGSLLNNFQNLNSGQPTRAFEFLFIDGVEQFIDAPLKEASEAIVAELQSILEQALATIPTPSAEDIKDLIRNAILGNDAVLDLNEAFFDLLSPVTNQVDKIATQVTANLNNLIQQGIEAVAAGLNAAMEAVTSAISDFDLKAARIDGYLIANQEEIEQIHLEAEFEFGGDPDPTIYFAALDITTWNSENGKGACVDDGAGLMDVVISTGNISAEMLGSDIGIKEAALGFTLDGGIPIGIFGRVYTSGEIDFEAVVIRDIGCEIGVGAIELYFGATASGRFESYNIPKIAIYFGKTCDFGVLERLDPEVAGFVGEMVPLIGVYFRGSVEVPIFNFGCFFRVGVGADIGVWVFFPAQDAPGAFGGLIGGSAWGKIACLASIKGKVTVMGQKSGNQFKFSGSGWAGAGIGFCCPEDWHSISDVRDDSWCLTGDASFGATYSNGWKIDGPNVHCCN